MSPGNVEPFVLLNGETSASVSGPSSEIASTTKPLPLRASYMRCRCGISETHGLHHVAQNESRIGPLPTYCESEPWLPSMPVSVKSVTSPPVPPSSPPAPVVPVPPLAGPPPAVDVPLGPQAASADVRMEATKTRRPDHAFDMRPPGTVTYYSSGLV